MKRNNKRSFIIIMSSILIGILLGWLLFDNSSNSNDESHNHETENIDQIWTCSMHPQIRKSEPGNCPICGMDLIPLASEEDSEASPNAIKMSPTAMQLANVQTAVVQLGSATKKLNLTGKISSDERKVYTQTAHISGRIENLQVNFEGETVRKGQVVASLYSPELVSAQEELLIAFKNKESQPQLLTAAKNKLKNWKLTDRQIDKLMETGNAMDEFSVLADYSGVVLNLKVEKGDYLKGGQAFYEVADLSKLWVLLDVHESDLNWVNLGDQIKFSVKAYPNRQFSGKVTFIDPIIDPKTRVAKARVEVENTDGILKPEMLVNSHVSSQLDAKSNSIIVPKSAVMWTGERSVVYVKQAAQNGLHFTMREVELGASLGDAYMVENGLTEGEEIAVNGTFSIDAAAQLAGKPSMMNPEGGKINTGHNHEGMSEMQEATSSETKVSTIPTSTKAKKQLSSLFDSYFNLKNALVADDFEVAKKSAQTIQEILETIDMKLFEGKAHSIWMKNASALKTASKRAVSASEIEQLRTAFIELSTAIIDLNQNFLPLEFNTYVQHCPMANNNQGADWLSKEKEIRNPYFGSSMLSCGELKSI